MRSGLGSLLVILGSAALLMLPSVLCGGLYCYSCGSTLSPEQCNATQTDNSDCRPDGNGKREYRMALMAELPNGTIIGIRGCRSYSMAGCNSSDVCNSENETMSQGAHFKRCIGECCTTRACNLGFYPVFPVVSPEPAGSYASVMATGSVNLTCGTNKKKPGPTSRAVQALAGPYHWLIVAVSASFQCLLCETKVKI